MDFKLFIAKLYECSLRIPKDAKVVVDFSNVKRFINEDNLQIVTDFIYTKENNTLGIVFEEQLSSKDKKIMNYRFRIDERRF